MATGDIVVHGDLILPPTSGKGGKIMTTAGAPGASGYGWQDMVGHVMPKTSGVGTPTRTVYSGNIYDYAFIANDQTDFSFHIPHDYAPGTDLYFHLHQSHNGTNISGTVEWTIYTTYAKGHNQANFPVEIAPLVTYATVDLATTPQRRHRIDEIQFSAASPSATQLDTDDIEPDGIIIITCKMTTAPTVTAGSWFLHFTDLHYQSKDPFATTKNKAPNFYT